MKKRLIYLVFSLLIMLFIVPSCDDDEEYPTSDVLDELYANMAYWYLWNDLMPTVNLNDFSTSNPSELLDALRNTELDKWSYITTIEKFYQYYEAGTYVGYGFGNVTDSDGNIRIAFLYEDSDLNSYGIKRGWIIKKINGQIINESSDISNLLGSDDIGVSNTIEFESPLGVIVSEVFVKKLITMNTVLHKEVLDVNSDKVGYFVLKSFIEPSMDELTETFSYFNAEGVNEVVIDLRYNGGGRMDVAMYLVSFLISSEIDGQNFINYTHNETLSHENFGYNAVRSSSSLDLDKVYFITSKGSASASEAIINGLDPYLDVYLVGDDTYGKPVGMYSLLSNKSNLVYVPVTFKLTNSVDFGDYYDGLPADSYVSDALITDFGELEAVLSEVLNHISTGTFSSSKTSGDIFKTKVKEIRNLNDELGSI